MSRLAPILCALAALLAAGCAKKEPAHDLAGPGAHAHAHTAPHGGTAVVLGRELYHLELVRDADTGRLTAYVLDGHLENFVRIAAPSLELSATVAGSPRLLVLRAVGNAATGETVGDTAQFETQADWLKTTATFDAILPRIEIRGTTFTDVGFNFPAGNESK